MEDVAATEAAKPSLEEIITQHHGFVRRTLSHLGVCRRNLEDVELEVFLGVHRGLSKFDPTLSSDPSKAIQAWLLGICERQAASHSRRIARRRESFFDDEELSGLESGDPHPEDRCSAKEAQSLLMELLPHTTPERRAVLLAYDLEGTPMRDVALSLRIPLNTAWNRRHLGIQDLRAALRRRRAAGL